MRRTLRMQVVEVARRCRRALVSRAPLTSLVVGARHGCNSIGVTHCLGDVVCVTDTVSPTLIINLG